MKLWQKMFLIAFAGLIIFPSAVELAHVFSGHKHDFCNHYAESHFHENNIDCELFDFQKNSFSFPPLYSWSPRVPEASLYPIRREYISVSTFPKLHFSLRAPPAGV
ncbi:hypothetical protein HC174_06990 [Salinimicrobium sp. CDJ15-81-2]|nr:hypothetical protein [Salinimicrobium nanhaiense]